MGQSRTAWDVPPLGRPLAVRGRRDLVVVLDAFVPTTIDAWRGRAVVLPAGVAGVPSDAPDLLGDDPEGALAARAVVVRHGGDVAGRSPWFGARRRRLDGLLAVDPPAEPLLGVVVDPGGTSAVWVRGTEAECAVLLSRRDWRTAVG